jgi:hypothetical protein
MKKVIVYRNKNNTIGVIHGIDKNKNAVEDEDTYLKQLAKKHVPRGLKWALKEKSEFPKRSIIRSAWDIDFKTNKITVNKEKAKDAILATYRNIRDTTLKDLDGPELRAMSQDNSEELERIRKLKQKLRDLPDTISKEVDSKSNDVDSLSAYRATIPE